MNTQAQQLQIPLEEELEAIAQILQKYQHDPKKLAYLEAEIPPHIMQAVREYIEHKEKERKLAETQAWAKEQKRLEEEEKPKQEAEILLKQTKLCKKAITLSALTIMR